MGVPPAARPWGQFRAHPALLWILRGGSLWGVSPVCPRGLYGAESPSTCVDSEGQSLEWALPSPKGRPIEPHAPIPVGRPWAPQFPGAGRGVCFIWLVSRVPPKRPQAQEVTLQPLHKGVTRAMPSASHLNQQISIRAKVESTSEK